MARVMEPTTKQEAGYREWVASRPPNVRAVAERFDPWSLYRLNTTGSRVMVLSFGEEEDGRVTLTVSIRGAFNFTFFDRDVFGVSPDDLEPCDLPASNEVLGAMLSSQDVDDHIDTLRVMARPDLWELDATGKAIRKSGTMPARTDA